MTERCGFAAIIGAPNAGKSTLVNRLVGAKVSIVTHKIQTTRAQLRGIAIKDQTQVILIDTPGIFDPKRRLDHAMVDAAWSGADDADMTVLVVDSVSWAKRPDRIAAPDSELVLILKRLSERKRPKVLALNKVDAVPRESLLELATVFDQTKVFSDIFMISALDGDGVEDLFDRIARAMPSSPWLYPEDQVADVPMRLMAAEVTREKLFLRLHQELPYASTIATELWEERKDGSVRIEQTIYVERNSQKSIVLGKGGRTIKSIGAEARQELQQMLDRKVHLFLFVKVRENWSQDPQRYQEIGLEFPRT